MNMDDNERRIARIIARDLIAVGTTRSMEVTMYAAGMFLSYSRSIMEAYPGEDHDEVLESIEAAHKEGLDAGTEMWRLVRDRKESMLQVLKTLCGDNSNVDVQMVGATGPAICSTECPNWEDCGKKVVSN